jgi:hypothetical protein
MKGLIFSVSQIIFVLVIALALIWWILKNPNNPLWIVGFIVLFFSPTIFTLLFYEIE